LHCWHCRDLRALAQSGGLNDAIAGDRIAPMLKTRAMYSLEKNRRGHKRAGLRKSCQSTPET
jgi:hypothetical protein